MKKIMVLFFLFISTDAAAGFVHPMDFNNSEAQKNEVLEYIKSRVRHDYCDSGIDMCQETTLRMMENENLKAFKEASRATDRKIMDRVIYDYCQSGVDMCNYNTILMMYNENMKAGSEKLRW